MVSVVNPVKIFTWHIHGSYLYYLSKGDYVIYIPVSRDRTNRNIGRGETFPFGNNVIEVPVEEVISLDIDCILYQHRENYLVDQYKILSAEQRKLPKIFLEHDTPKEHPTDMRHVVEDPEVLIVHVTNFNRLMWNNNGCNTLVVEHGVTDKEISYKGTIEKGIVVINDLPSRGRMLGFDVFNEIRKEVPLDLIGMNTGELGLGEILHPQVPDFTSRYRFFFNPIRYTSFGLAVCEAMMIGIPVVGMATTEMPAVFQNGINGIVHNDPQYLIRQMKLLIENKEKAIQIGAAGQATAREKFNITRFTSDWKRVFDSVIKKKSYEKADSLYQ